MSRHNRKIQYIKFQILVFVRQESLGDFSYYEKFTVLNIYDDDYSVCPF